MSDDDSEELIPHDVIEPLINWMIREGYSKVHLVARAMPDTHEQEPPRDESQNLLYCDEQPDSEALLDIYAVTDEQGHCGVNGPSAIPQHVLRPLIRALDDASVSELVIAAAEAAQPARPSVLTASRRGDIEEHEIPAAGAWPVIAFRVSEDG